MEEEDPRRKSTSGSTFKSQVNIRFHFQRRHRAWAAAPAAAERSVKRLRGGLVFKAHRLLYHSTLVLRVIKKKKKKSEEGTTSKILRPFNRKPRTESGLDSLMSAIFAWQRPSRGRPTLSPRWPPSSPSGTASARPDSLFLGYNRFGESII